MKARIKKERIYLCSQSASVSTVVTIEGNVEKQELGAAIISAAGQNEILSSVITMDPDGTAYYQVEDRKSYLIQYTDDSWQKIIEQQTKIRFEIEKGELIRFFITTGPDSTQLVIINHHLAGDGLSIAFFIETIMTCLSGQAVDFKPLQLLDTKPYQIKMPFMTGFLMKGMKKSWGKSGRIFSFTDSERVFNNYWKEHNLKVFSHTIESKSLATLQSICKQNDVTMNSLLLTAVYKAASKKIGIGISTNLREADNRSMGNYATGVTVPYEYNHELSFYGNMVNVHKLTYSYLDDPQKKYFLMQFINDMPETLIDATYFTAFDAYQNKQAMLATNMFGYTDNPQSTGMTNLAKLPIAACYGPYHLTDYFCMPPLVANLRRIFGVATLDDKMCITMSVMENEQLAQEESFFEEVITSLPHHDSSIHKP